VAARGVGLPSWLRPAVVLLAVVCLAGLFATEADDSDFWWHLKTGQYIVQNHALPFPDPFAYTTAMNPPAYPGEEQLRHFNLTHEWLAQAAMYGVYSIGGLPGVILFRAAVLTALCALVALLAWRRSGSFYAGVAAAFATASVTIWVAIDRPMILTFLFIAAFMTVLEFRRWLWVLPAIALVWANSHGGFFMGWVVLAAYCAETIPWLARFFPKRAQEAGYGRKLWVVAACTVAISFFNPNGFGVLATLAHYRASSMTNNLVEWQRPYLWGSPYSFDVLLYAAVLVVAVSWRKVRISDWALFVAFGAAALAAFRNISLIGIVGPILIAAYFPWRSRIPRVAAWIVPVALIGALGTGVARGSFFQLHAAMWKFPAGAADYLLANHVPGPLFNTYEYGGYLIWRLWPGYKVFIDGRSLSETLYKDYEQILVNPKSAQNELTGPRAELLKRYGIETVVMNTFQLNTGGAYTLALALGNPQASEWQLVYDDAQSLVFRHQPPAGTAVFADKLPRVLDHLERECEVNIENSAAAALCGRTLASFYASAGDIARARNILQRAVARDPAAADALRQLGGR
jgi:hypothetical protein